MIYDCFTFFNELDLLEIRFNELYPYVDKFVLVEANKTFQNTPKPFYFEENKHLFKDFLDKVVHIKVTKYPLFIPLLNPFSTWKMEFHQRNQILKGLTSCKPNDLILLSDVDEIPCTEKITKHSNSITKITVLRQHMSAYFLNNRVVYTEESNMNKKEAEKGIWHGTLMIPYSKMTTPQKIRQQGMKRRKRVKLDTIENAGWHFTYQGGVDKIITKLESFAHEELNKEEYKNRDQIFHKINNGIDLFNRNVEFNIDLIDEKYPLYIQKIAKEKDHKLSYLIFNKI